MALFDQFQDLIRSHAAVKAIGADPFGVKMERVVSPTEAIVEGRPTILAGTNDYLIIDADSHASIYDACKMTSATVIRFKHNDTADLDKRLQRLAGTDGNKIIVVEGIYSMLGDQAPLAEMAAIKRKHGAYLVVDEAHSMGVIGDKGRGVAEAAGVEADVDFIVGTFSKSLRAIGGFCVSDHPEFDVLRVRCRPYMFTASLPPSIVASVTAALAVVERRPDLRARLWANVSTLYDGLKRHGLSLGPQKGPVVAVQLPSPELAVQAWQALLRSGVYVNLALPPATPNGASLLRCSVCAAHSRHQLERVIDTITKVAYEIGVLSEPARAVG